MAAGLCGSLAHGTLMFLKEWMNWLPTFQPYRALQRMLSEIIGDPVQPLVPFLLSFLNGTLVISLIFSLLYFRLPGRSGAAKGFALGLVCWAAMGIFFFPLIGLGLFASGVSLGLRPAAFSLAMVLSYSMCLGIIYSVLEPAR